jgi:flagellar hook-length control protein FliK
VTPLNFDNLSGMLTRDTMLPAMVPTAAAGGAGSFDSHLLRAQGTTGHASSDDREGGDASHSPTDDPGSADRGSAVSARDDEGSQSRTSARRDDRTTTSDRAASSTTNDNSTRDRSAVDADRDRRKDDHRRDDDSDTASAAGAAARPTSDSSHNSKDGSSDSDQGDSYCHGASRSSGTGDSKGAGGSGASDSGADATAADAGGTNASGTDAGGTNVSGAGVSSAAAAQAALQGSIGSVANAAIGPGSPVAGQGANQGQTPTTGMPGPGSPLPPGDPVAATDTAAKTADAKQVDPSDPQTAAGAVAQAAAAQAAQQSAASARSQAAPSDDTATEPAPVPASAGSPTGSTSGGSSGVGNGRRVGVSFAESLAAVADSSGQPADAQPGAAPTISPASVPGPTVDAPKPSNTVAERQTHDAKPADVPLSARDTSATQPSQQAAKPAGVDAASASDQADRVRFVQRVARAFESATDGGTVRLRLSPPELGSLHIEVTVRGGKMNAHVEAETQSARTMLLDNLPALRQQLAERQIHLERFDVDLGGRSSGNLSQQSQDQTGQKPSQSGSPAASRPKAQGPTAVAGQPAAARPGYGGRLDIVI